jgi:menaquinone-specific isochorismate synthase
MTNIHDIRQRIRQLLDQTPSQAGRWVSVTLPLSGVSIHSLPEKMAERYFWARPERGELWLGLASAWQARQKGDNHLIRLAEEAEWIASRVTHLDPDGCGFSPRLSLVSESEGGHIHLPLVQFGCCNGATTVTVTPDPAQPDGWLDILDQALAAIGRAPEPLPGPLQMNLRQQQPEVDLWMRLAEQAVREIAENRLKKLVLTRRATLIAQRRLDPRHLVRSLGYQHPHCTIFAVDANEGCWVGASPEVLLNRRGDRLFCEAVAGTVRRDPYESVDRELGEWLLRDPKNRYEHKLVVESFRKVLAPICGNLHIDAQPRLLRLRGLQHLHTPISGALREPMHPLRMAHELHPSPAVCGTPMPEARAWLRKHEPLDRRWFTGLTGWLDLRGDAALNVVLRCAYIENNRVDLYAGAGLVADSDSLAEWEETELKLGNMIKALQDA